MYRGTKYITLIQVICTNLPKEKIKVLGFTSAMNKDKLNEKTTEKNALTV